MNKLLVALHAILLLAGCGSTPESLTEELIEKSEELLGLLEQVVDEESAEQKKAEIHALGLEHKILYKNWSKAMEHLSVSEQKELNVKFEKPMRKITAKLLKEAFRLKAAPYGKELMGSWWDGRKPPDS